MNTLDRGKILTEALPYIQRYNGKTVVINCGGSMMDSKELRGAVASDVMMLRLVGIQVVLVHGMGVEVLSAVEQGGVPVTYENEKPCLTEAVVEKKIPVLTHKHYITTLTHSHPAPGGETGQALTGSYLGEDSLVSEKFNPVLQDQNIVCWEHGKELPIEDGFIILNRKLEVGDKVLLLRVEAGKRFIVLSRVFDIEGGS